MAIIDPNTGALSDVNGQGVLSADADTINTLMQAGQNDARKQALYSGLIGMGAGLLNYDARRGYGAALGGGLEGFNKAYDTELVANRPKVTPLANGAFSQISFPDGTVQIVANKDVAKYLEVKAAKDAELWKAKTDYKSEADVRAAGQKLGNKTGLENAGEVAGSMNQANELRGIADKLVSTKDTVAGKEIAPTGTAAGIINALPNTVASAIAPNSVELKQDAERIIQNSLRATLGAQFTEKEGTRFLERAYNPALSPQQNAERLKKMADELELIASNKDAAAEYMKKNGTLAGFQPSAPTPNAGGLKQISTEADWAALPSGTRYIGPDGKTRTKR